MREIQVLENRTHPNMNMSSTGGFILTGVKVSKNVIKVEQRGKFVGKGMAAFVYSGRRVGKKRKAGEDDGLKESEDGGILGNAKESTEKMTEN